MTVNKSNVVLITTDQQRFDTFGPEAPSFMRTPHLDYLANDGIRFARAYADCPVCVPGRCSYMTGQSVFTHGMGVNDRTSDYFGSDDTLPTLLRACGYQTAAFGKMHFNPPHNRHGFDETHTLDEYYRWIARTGSLEQPRRHGLGENELFAGMATVPEALTLTSWITEQAVDFITHRRDPTQPFFAWVSYSKPHPPLDPPEPYYSMYRGCETRTPWRGEWSEDEMCPAVVRHKRLGQGRCETSDALIHEAHAAYYGLITHIDYNIGRIMAALQDTGPWFSGNDDTLIVFAADHGEYLFDHGMGGKGEFYEGSAHVPLVVRTPRTWPDRPVGVSDSHIVSLMDILPTIVHAAGGEVPDTVEGQDLLRLVRDQLESPRKYLFAGQGLRRNHPDAINWAGITDGRWKYIWYYIDGSEQLFDLDTDPHELRDLARESQYGERKSGMRSQLVAELNRRGGRFLQGGDLYARPYTQPSESKLRSGGFAGWMRDDHPHDAVH
jgi:arylsulfatase